ncbi:MAG: DUF1513 domain-containing protein [Deltaproteobacteria bacterium]|nr:DUF1513 domain-containing protein [Deltaproteobacteria bacterium]
MKLKGFSVIVYVVGSFIAACSPETRITAGRCDPQASSWTVWVTNQAAGIDSVTVLRNHDEDDGGSPSVSGQVLATIPVGRAPHSIIFRPDGRYAYVANLSSPPDAGTVSVIDTTSYQVVATVGAGVKPHGLGVTPDGRYLWVANEKSNDVSVIDTTTNTAEAQTIAVGTGPLLVVFTPDGKKAYVSLGAAGGTAVVDVASRSLVKTITTGRGAMGLVVQEDGRYAFETEGTDNRVSRIDTSTDSVANVLTYDGTLVEPHGIAFAGDELLITNRSGQSLVFADTRTLAKTASLSILGRPDIIGISPNCEKAYLTLRDRAAVAVVHIPDRTYLGTIELDAGDTHGIAILRGQ